MVLGEVNLIGIFIVCLFVFDMRNGLFLWLVVWIKFIFCCFILCLFIFIFIFFEMFDEIRFIC